MPESSPVIRSLPAAYFAHFAGLLQNGFLPIGTLGGATSYAMAVSSTGAIAGHAQNAAGMLHAFLYDGTVLTDLGTLGGWQSFAYGVNASNSVVGYSLLADGNPEPATWLLAGGALLFFAFGLRRRV